MTHAVNAAVKIKLSMERMSKRAEAFTLKDRLKYDDLAQGLMRLKNGFGQAEHSDYTRRITA